MIDLGPHGGFILAAYGFTALALIALLGWIVADGRSQARQMNDLEAERRQAEKDKPS